MDAIGASTENLKKSLNQTKTSVTQSSLNSFVQLFTFNVLFFPHYVLIYMKLMLMLKLMVNGQPNVAVDVNMSDLCLLMSFHRLIRVGPFKGPVPIQYLFTFILLL